MRRIRSTVALAVVALAGAACGELETSSPGERLAEAASATRSEGSAAFSLDMNIEMGRDGSGMDMTVAGDGVADLRNAVGRMEMRPPGMGSPMTMIFDGDMFYMQLPGSMSEGETQWIRQEARGAMASGPGALRQNPLGMIDALVAVSGDVRSLGADTARGADVDGYAFTLSGARLWGEGEQVSRSLRELEIPAEVWLDGENRVRRMVMEVDIGPLMEAVRERTADSPSDEEGHALGRMLGGMEGTMTMTTELHDFGTTVEVEIPDEAEIVNRSELQREMRGGPGGGDGATDTAGGGARDTTGAGGDTTGSRGDTTGG